MAPAAAAETKPRTSHGPPPGAAAFLIIDIWCKVVALDLGGSQQRVDRGGFRLEKKRIWAEPKWHHRSIIIRLKECRWWNGKGICQEYTRYTKR